MTGEAPGSRTTALLRRLENVASHNEHHLGQIRAALGRSDPRGSD